MDHNLAIENNAAERYLLGELNEVEIEEYEEHYFSCPICAQEVKLGSEFIDHARKVFKTDFIPESKPVITTEPQPVISRSTAWGRFWSSILQPAPAFAYAALFVALGFNIYQNALVQDLRRPEVLAAALMLRASRGVNDQQVIVGPRQSFRVAFDIPKRDFSSYVVEIWNDAGVKKYSIPMPADQAKDTIHIKFRGGSLQPGNYALVIQGVTSRSEESTAKQEVARYPFSLSIHDQ